MDHANDSAGDTSSGPPPAKVHGRYDHLQHHPQRTRSRFGSRPQARGAPERVSDDHPAIGQSRHDLHVVELRFLPQSLTVRS